MLASELRANARKSLAGKWGKAALVVLCYLLLMYVISFVLALIPLLGPIASFVISVPISYGFVVSFIKLKRGEEVKYTGFLSEGFANFGRAWGVCGHTILKMIVPVVLIIVFAFLLGFSSTALVASGIISGGSGVTAGFSGLSIIAIIGYIASVIYATVKGLLYSLSNYILYDNPNMTNKEIVEESARLMKGNRWKYVWLGLTFIGWIILSAFTFYIGLLWVVPYIAVTTICFYESLSGNVSKENIVVEAENNNPISE